MLAMPMMTITGLLRMSMAILSSRKVLLKSMAYDRLSLEEALESAAMIYTHPTICWRTCPTKSAKGAGGRSETAKRAMALD